MDSNEDESNYQRSINVNEDDKDDIIAQAEAPMIQEEAQENLPQTAQIQNNTRSYSNQQANQLMLGVGDDAYEVLDENGERILIEFLEFLNCFRVESEESAGVEPNQAVPFYVEHLHALRQEKAPFHKTLFINYQHLLSFNLDLCEAIEENYVRFEPFLVRAFQTFWKDSGYELSKQSSAASEVSAEDPLKLQIAFYNMNTILGIRHLHMNYVGRLVSVGVTITRTSDVKPELQVGCYTCAVCGFGPILTKQECSTYTVPTKCRNTKCENISQFELETSKSEFMDWQKMKCQELSKDIPPGNMPRSLDVLVRGEMVDKCRPGGNVVFTGSLVVIPLQSGVSVGEVAKLDQRGQESGGVSGLRGMGVKELTYRTVFIANSVVSDDKGDDNRSSSKIGEEQHREFSEEEIEVVRDMRRTGQLYTKMVNSIAPQVFGHTEVKRGVLLMLFSGVHKRTPENMALRGDVNVCIVGDPSTAKSQFLKYVHSFWPKSIYTSGKTSSAAGLTASVVRDNDTGDFAIEAGALMLADTGICCIDEFDKMDIADQVAIHEAMEQQTISITKAGISATLHARTSILAAANPIQGRYDRSKTLKANVSLSAPILSRFDLFFVVLDEQNELIDFNVAKHILSTHRSRTSSHTTDTNAPFTSDQLRLYIQYAKTIHPRITSQSQAVLIDCYKKLRQGDSIGRSRTAYRITVRQMESMIRLSEALARLYLDEVVKPNYVEEAYRLLKKSIIRVESDDVALDEFGDESRELDNTQGNIDEAPESQVSELQRKRKVNPGEYDEQETGTKKRKKTKITFEEYEIISNKIAAHLRYREENDLPPLKWSETIDWYLDDNEKDNINNEDEFHAAKKKIHLVIGRLVDVDSVLIFVDEQDEDEILGKKRRKEERLIAVHPNYVIS